MTYRDARNALMVATRYVRVDDPANPPVAMLRALKTFEDSVRADERSRLRATVAEALGGGDD